MNIEEAVERIIWRVNDGGWKQDKAGKDYRAINKIIRYVTIKQKEQVLNHDLFAKLYVKMTRVYMDKGILIKELHKELSEPFSNHILRFTDALNDDERELLFSSIGIPLLHPRTIPDDLKEKNTIDLINALKNNKVNQDKLFHKTWKYKDVEEIMEKRINDLLNIYYDKTDFKKT